MTIHTANIRRLQGLRRIVQPSTICSCLWLRTSKSMRSAVTDQRRRTPARADILAKCLLAARTKGKNLEAYGKVTVDSPIPYLLTDLTGILTNEMGKLDRAGDTAPFQRLKTKIDELRADPRYTFMFSGMLVSDTMGAFLAKLFRLPSHGRPISIVDVSGVPSDITSVVVSVLARMVRLRHLVAHEPQRPILLVCEEAIATSTDDAPGPRCARYERTPGSRKYGVKLGSSPRTSDLARSAANRHDIRCVLNNDRDQPASPLRSRRRAGSSTPYRRCAIAMHRLREGRRDPDPGPLRRSRAESARPRPTRASPTVRETAARRHQSAYVKRGRGHGR